MKKRTVIAPAAIAVLIAMQPITLLAEENVTAKEDASFVDAVRSKVRAMFDGSDATKAPAAQADTEKTPVAVAPAAAETSANNGAASQEVSAPAEVAAEASTDKVMTYKEAVQTTDAAKPAATEVAETPVEAAIAAKTPAEAVAESAPQSDAKPASDHWNWDNWGKRPERANAADRAKQQAQYQEQLKNHQAEMKARAEASKKSRADRDAKRAAMRQDGEARYKAEMARRNAEMKKMRAGYQKDIPANRSEIDAKRAKRAEMMKKRRAERASGSEQQNSRYAEQKKAAQAEMAKRKAEFKQRALAEKERLEAALKKDPKNPKLYGRMGAVMAFMGDRENAAKMFQASSLIAKERSMEMRIEYMKRGLEQCSTDERLKSMIEKANKDLSGTRARIQKLTTGS